MLKAMAGLCRDLDIRTIAEMIEQNEQAEKLQSLGIDLAQLKRFESDFRKFASFGGTGWLKLLLLPVELVQQVRPRNCKAKA